MQYGKEQGKKIYDHFMATSYDEVRQNLGIEVTGFDFGPNNLQDEMLRVKGTESDSEGLIISYAGMSI